MRIYNRHTRIISLTMMLCASVLFARAEEPAQTRKPEGAVAANEFVPLSAFKTAKRRRYAMVKLVWAGHIKSLFAWPQHYKHEAAFFLYRPGKSSGVELKKGSFKDKQFIGKQLCSPLAYCYLPKRGKLLFFKPGYRFKPKEDPTTWLLDPESGMWEAVAFKTIMAPRDNDYDPGFGRATPKTAPLWGNLVYDPVNGEAVHFGGAATWGRLSKTEVPVKPGDWIYDEQKKQYILLWPETKVKKARRWFPAHCGTWVFSESDSKWGKLEQPLIEQPSGRILPSMVYVPDTKEIVMFGGDTLAACLNDTWIYNCEKKKWTLVETPVAPSHRAGAPMVYVPEAKQVLLIGGYTGQWKALADVWAWDPRKKIWSALNITLPGKKQGWVSACYDPERKRVVLSRLPSMRGRPQEVELFGLRLDMKSLTRRKPEPTNPLAALHIGSKRILAEKKNASARLDLAKLPANTWVDPGAQPRMPKRDWGQIVYDARTHQAIAWGGGHSTYPGLNYDVYDLQNNRWLLQNHPCAFNPLWWHGDSNCPPGVSLDGSNYVPGHSRRGYGVDPLSGAVVTCGGDVFDIKTRRFVKKMRRSLFYNSGGRNPAAVTTPHGLYFVGPGKGRRDPNQIAKPNVAEAKWERVAEGGAFKHIEFNHVSYDSKRDRIIYVDIIGAHIWAFDFKTRKWEELKTKGPRPAKVVGGSTYVPELDAVCMLFPKVILKDWRKNKDEMFFFKLEDRKWYTAPYKGARQFFANTHGLCADVYYDPKLKMLIYFSRAGWGVRVMRLVPKGLKLTPLAK
jgi:Galactose oxidase, central domain/Kelch motif